MYNTFAEVSEYYRNRAEGVNEQQQRRYMRLSTTSRVLEELAGSPDRTVNEVSLDVTIHELIEALKKKGIQKRSQTDVMVDARIVAGSMGLELFRTNSRSTKKGGIMGYRVLPQTN